MKLEPSLTNYLNTSISKENRIINVSKGPQFKTKGGTALAMLFLLFFLMSIVLLVNSEFIASLILFIISSTLFSLVIDIHGIQVDTNMHMIRDYKAFLWFRIGEWSNINEYKSIYLTQKNVSVRTTGYAGQAAETYHYYHIKLVDEVHKKEIFLAEYKNYYKAQKISKNIADSTGLQFRDFLKGGIRRK
jgi:hypothetical protein